MDCKKNIRNLFSVYKIFPQLISILAITIFPSYSFSSHNNETVDITGVWRGFGQILSQRHYHRVNVTLSISGREALADFRIDSSKSVRVKLLVESSSDKEFKFEIIDYESKNLNPTVVKYFPLVKLRASLVEPSPKNYNKHVTLELKGTAEPRILPLGKKHTQTIPAKEMIYKLYLPRDFDENKKIRDYGHTGLTKYSDWRNIYNLQSPRINDQETIKRLTDDLKMLQDSGWKCLSQDETYFSSQQPRPQPYKYYATPGSPTRFLVISRVPNKNIIFTAQRNPPGYVSVLNEPFNYPIIELERGGNLILHMSTDPNPGQIDQEVFNFPVTIFTFSNRFGDYGTGCQLGQFGLDEVVQSNVYFQAIGKMILAVGFEGSRLYSLKNETEILQLLSTYGRNAMIESALKDVSPNTSNEMIGYYSRWVAMLLSQDISASSFFRENLRESIIQIVAKENPEYTNAAKLLDLLVDIQVQKETYQELLTTSSSN